MELHHKKHHQAYITNFNAAQEQYAQVSPPGMLLALALFDNKHFYLSSLLSCSEPMFDLLTFLC